MNKRKIKEFIKGFKEMPLKMKIFFILLIPIFLVLCVVMVLLAGLWLIRSIHRVIETYFWTQSFKEVFAFISVI